MCMCMGSLVKEMMHGVNLEQPLQSGVIPVVTDHGLYGCAKKLSNNELAFVCGLHSINRLGENLIDNIKQLDPDLFDEIKKVDEFLSKTKKIFKLSGIKTSVNKLLKNEEVDSDAQNKIAEFDRKAKRLIGEEKTEYIAKIKTYPTFHMMSTVRFRYFCFMYFLSKHF